MIVKHLTINRLPRNISNNVGIEYIKVDEYNFIFLSDKNINNIYVYHLKPTILPSEFTITNITLKISNESHIDVTYKTSNIDLHLNYNPFITKFAFNSSSVLYLDPLTQLNKFDEFYYEPNLQDVLDNFKYVHCDKLAEMIIKNNMIKVNKKYRYIGFISPILTEEEPYYENSYVRFLE